MLKCFTAATPVQMVDGSTKPIGQVQVGDQVLSRNPDTGKDEAKTVTSKDEAKTVTGTIERHAPSVVDVVLHDAKTGKAETLTCTPEHPLYVQGQGLVEAGNVALLLIYTETRLKSRDYGSRTTAKKAGFTKANRHVM